MKKQITPFQQFRGTVKAPCSKSFAQRAIALGALNQYSTCLSGISSSNDVSAAIDICRSLGAKIDVQDGEIKIERGIELQGRRKYEINCGESGLSARLFSAFSLLTPAPFFVNGEGTLLSRKMDMVLDGLQQFGKDVLSASGRLPFSIEGATQTGAICVSGDSSSQFLTGLLLVAPFLSSSTTINVAKLNSRPYIDLTLEVLSDFGITIENDQYKTFKISGNQQIEHPINYQVEGDWSAASIFVVAAAIAGSVKLEGLKRDSLQGDKRIVDVVQKVGANVRWENENIVIEKGQLNCFQFDATDCPDLFPALVVLAAHCKGVSVINGALRLLNKESNRGKTLQEECEKIGVKLMIEEDVMYIYGKEQIETAEKIHFNSHNDHRIAMAMSLFAVDSKYPIHICQAEAVNKSYPLFFQDLEACLWRMA